MTSRINQWLSQVKQFLFLYRDGHFELPYLANSPEIMMASLKRMPLAKLHANEKCVTTNNIFTRANINYRELTEGLWIIVSEIEFKKDVCIKAVYDDAPCDYYYLTHFAYTKLYKSVLPGEAPTQITGWNLYKPGTHIKRYLTKGDKGVFMNFAFDKNWFERNIPVRDVDHETVYDQNSTTGAIGINLENTMQRAEIEVAKILLLISQEDQMQLNTLALNIACLEVINQFFTKSVKPKTSEFQLLNDADALMVRRAEKILAHALTVKFPGIEAIAHLLFVSETKLKTDFKAVHHTTLYKYYSQMQMEEALIQLKTKNIAVKELAIIFGYNSPSKFSAAFYKHHKFHPSKINQ